MTNQAPKLSILIPSLHSRAKQLDSLLLSLHTQMQTIGYPVTDIRTKTEWFDDHAVLLKHFQYAEAIEICVFTDEKHLKIGAKRNILVDASNGEYSAFIDDDDRVSEKYISTILKKVVETAPDCCDLMGLYQEDGLQQGVFHHSMIYDEWKTLEGTGGKTFQRSINHLNTIKTSILKQIKFPEINHGEDHEFSKRLMASGLLKREGSLEEVLYFYDYVSNK